MLTLVHESPYFHIYVDAPKHFLYYVFTPLTEKMTNEEYLKELEIYNDIVKKYQIKRVLGRMTDFRFTIVPEIQEWINENIFSLYKEIGMTKIALVLGEADFFARVSVEQTMEESQDGSFATGYFDDEEQAKAWLFADLEV